MIKIKNIILASKSAIRQKLLENSGVEFCGKASNIDEELAKISMRADGLKPADQAFELAKLKALKISRGNDDLVIGCDQILNFNGEAYDKVDNLADAKQRLKLFQGQTHSLEGACVIMQDGKLIWRYDSKADLTMHSLNDEVIDEYLVRAGPQILNAVGCYELEGVGAQLFSKIKGDYFAILGLPLIELLGFLQNYQNGFLQNNGENK